MLEAGAHHVDLRFAPPLWTLGWVLTALTVIAPLAWAGLALRRRAALRRLAW